MAQLKSIRSLLGLLKRYKPSPPADPQFFQWAERVVRAHHKAGDAVELVTVVSELVPFLPDHQRSTLARLVTEPKAEKAQTNAGSFESLKSSESSEWRRMFLDGPLDRLKAPVVLSSRAELETSAASRHRGRLWGMLASSVESTDAKETASQMSMESLAEDLLLLSKRATQMSTCPNTVCTVCSFFVLDRRTNCDKHNTRNTTTTVLIRFKDTKLPNSQFTRRYSHKSLPN